MRGGKGLLSSSSLRHLATAIRLQPGSTARRPEDRCSCKVLRRLGDKQDMTHQEQNWDVKLIHGPQLQVKAASCECLQQRRDMLQVSGWKTQIVLRTNLVRAIHIVQELREEICSGTSTLLPPKTFHVQQ
jgi:hypothetical protein